MKRILIMLSSAAMLTALCIGICAMSLRASAWSSTTQCIPSLSIEDGKARCTLTVITLDPEDEITATVTLKYSDPNGEYGDTCYTFPVVQDRGILHFDESGFEFSSLACQMTVHIVVKGERGTDVIDKTVTVTG